jgi:hypothetical protein
MRLPTVAVFINLPEYLKWHFRLVSVEASVCDENMTVKVEVKDIAEGLGGDNSAGHGPFSGRTIR